MDKPHLLVHFCSEPTNLVHSRLPWPYLCHFSFLISCCRRVDSFGHLHLSIIGPIPLFTMPKPAPKKRHFSTKPQPPGEVTAAGLAHNQFGNAGAPNSPISLEVATTILASPFPAPYKSAIQPEFYAVLNADQLCPPPHLHNSCSFSFLDCSFCPCSIIQESKGGVP